MMQELTREAFGVKTAAPIVEIIDERDLMRGRMVDLSAEGKVAPKGWQRLTGRIAAFLSDDMHLETSPELGQDVADAQAFISRTAVPAFEQVRASLERDGRVVQVTDTGAVALLWVRYQGRTEFSAAVRTRLTPDGVVPVIEAWGRRTRRAVACVRLDGMTKVMAAVTSEVPASQVAAYVLACHRDGQLD
jgi:hypothetical protein